MILLSPGLVFQAQRGLYVAKGQTELWDQKKKSVCVGKEGTPKLPCTPVLTEVGRTSRPQRLLLESRAHAQSFSKLSLFLLSLHT